MDKPPLPQACADTRPSAVLCMIFPVALRSATKRSDHQATAFQAMLGSAESV
jgi:hypothetical protein